MFIEFSCRCGHEFRTRPENAGKPIICPNCTSRQVVPAAESDGEEHASVANAKHSFDDDSDLEEVETPRSRGKAPSSHLLAMLEEDEAWPIKGKRAEPKQRPESSTKTRSKESRRAPGGDTIRSVPSSMKETRKPHQVVPQKEKPRRKAKQPDSYEQIPDDDIFDAEDLDKFELDELEVVDELLDDLPVARRKRRDDVEEPPKKSAKGKSKKKSPQEDNNSALSVIIGGMVFGMIVIGVVGFFAIPPLIAKLQEGREIQVPKDFEKFTEQNFNFSCEVPKDWEVDARGGQGNVPPTVRIEKGNIKIAYRSSMSGAAIQDMAQAGANQAGELPDELKPVAKVHEYQREKFKQETPDYTEVGPVERIDTGIGEGRLSEFTGSVGFGGKFYGYRVTLLTTQYQWNVVCKCKTKREFEAYKPIFRRIIASSGR